MISSPSDSPYTLLDLGFNKFLAKPFGYLSDAETTPEMVNSITGGVAAKSLVSGELLGNTVVKEGYLQSENFVSGSTGWQLTPTSAELNISTVLKSLDIPDTTTANSFHVDENGNAWWGATTLGSAVAKVLNTGVATFTKITISGGADVSFVSNTLDTSAKTILSDFTFSPSDYSGAFKTGDITWNTTTGAVTGGTGMVINKNGIVGASAGVTKFSITTAGDATFAGTLSAAVGSLGAITTGLITLDTTGYLRTSGKDNYSDTTAGIFIGYDSSAYKLNIGDDINYIKWNGTYFEEQGIVNAKRFTGYWTDGLTETESNMTITRSPITSLANNGDATAGEWGLRSPTMGTLDLSSNVFTWGNDFVFRCRIIADTGATDDGPNGGGSIFWGLTVSGSSIDSSIGNNGIIIATGGGNTRHIGFFKARSGSLIASNDDGTTQNTTIITGIDTATAHDYLIVVDSGTSAKFYIDNVLKATHVANLPTGTDQPIINFTGRLGRNISHVIDAIIFNAYELTFTS